MKKIASGFFDERYFTFVNLMLFAVCVVGGFALYGGKLYGGSDDTYNISQPSWDFLSVLYLKTGQAGTAAVLHVLTQLLVKTLRVTPAGFPWWLFAAANAFCYAAIAYTVAMTGKRLLEHEGRTALFLFLFICALWLLHPNTYLATLFRMPVTLLWGYGVPSYLLTLALYLSAAKDFGSRPSDWYWVGGFYLTASLSGTSTFLLCAPALFTGAIVIRAFQEKHSPLKVLRKVGFFAVLSVLSATYVWTQPGFHQRQIGLNFHVPGFVEIRQWYAEAVDAYFISIFMTGIRHERIYQLLGVTLPYWAPVLLAIAVLGAGLCFAKIIQPRSHPQLVLFFSEAAWALTLLAGFFSCMSTKFATAYFPFYTSVYPTLLFASSLGFGVTAAFRFFKPDTLAEISTLLKKPLSGNGLTAYRSYWRRLQPLAAGAVLLPIFYLGVIPHARGIYRTFQVQMIANAIRGDFQKKIAAAYYETGKKNYFVTGCPRSVGADQFWGVEGYMRWMGFEDGFGVLNSDSMVRDAPPEQVWPERKEWLEIPCLQLTPEQQLYLRP